MYSTERRTTSWNRDAVEEAIPFLGIVPSGSAAVKARSAALAEAPNSTLEEKSNTALAWWSPEGGEELFWSQR